MSLVQIQDTRPLVCEVIAVYENGKRMNHYANKMIHKRRQKNHFLTKGFPGVCSASWADYKAHADDFDSLKYWKVYYLSGLRKFARTQTNRVLRARLRSDIAAADYNNMHAPQHAEYQKSFDYLWTIW